MLNSIQLYPQVVIPLLYDNGQVTYDLIFFMSGFPLVGDGQSALVILSIRWLGGASNVRVHLAITSVIVDLSQHFLRSCLLWARAFLCSGLL